MKLLRVVAFSLIFLFAKIFRHRTGALPAGAGNCTGTGVILKTIDGGKPLYVINCPAMIAYFKSMIKYLHYIDTKVFESRCK